MEIWMWRDERDGREKGRIWDDRGPSYRIIPQDLTCCSIVDIPVQGFRPQGQVLRNDLPTPLRWEEINCRSPPLCNLRSGHQLGKATSTSRRLGTVEGRTKQTKIATMTDDEVTDFYECMYVQNMVKLKS